MIGRIAETCPAPTFFRHGAGLTGHPAFAVNFFVTDEFGLQRPPGLFHTAATPDFLALLTLVLTLDPAVTVVSLWTVVICRDVVIPRLSLVAYSFHLFITSVISRTISVRLLFPAFARLINF